MDEAGQMISFQVIPGPRGPEEAEQRLRSAGLEQIKRSPDGRRLHVVAPRKLVEGVLGFPLREKSRQSRVGAAAVGVVDLELPEGAVLPESIQDVVDEVVFPVTPEYYQSPAQKRSSL
jgi:hypothetical protein